MRHALPYNASSGADLPVGRFAAAPPPIAPQRGPLGPLRAWQAAALDLGQMFDLQVKQDLG